MSPRQSDSAQSGHLDPPIVAELGRPETPEETAARKAETSRTHRANQTVLNLVAALVVSLGVVLLLVMVVVRPDSSPREPIDFHAVAAEAQPTVDTTLADPQVPEEWSANSAKLEQSVSDVTSWYVGFITSSEQFVGMRQGIEANQTWLASQLDFAAATGVVTIDDVTWQLYDNRTKKDVGNLAYVMSAELGESTVVLFGTASDSEFEELATSITTQVSKGNA